MQMVRVTQILVLVFSLLSCSKNTPSLTSTGPLNLEQKSSFESALNSAGNIFGAVNHIKRERAGLVLFDTVTNANQLIQQKMAEALKSGNCDIPIKNQKNSTVLGSGDRILSLFEKNFQMSISGKDCPVALSMSVNGSPNGATTNGLMDYNYAVKNSDFAKLNDVTAANFKGEGKLTVKAVDTGSLYEANALGNGSFQSQESGEVKVEFIGAASVLKSEEKGSNGKITVTALFGFKGFTVELKNILTYTGGDSPEENCTLNGERVSRETFYHLIEKAGGNVHNWPVFFKRPQ